MNTKADFINNAAKQATRMSILRAAQQSYLLYPPHRKLLNDDFVELPGVGCPILDFLIPHLSPQAKVIGVDTDADIIEKCRVVHKGKPAVWVCDDLIKLIANRNNNSLFDNVGVINFDPYLGPGRPLKSALKVLGDFARERERLAGHVLLIVNVTAARWQGGVTETLRWISQNFPTLLPGGHMPTDLDACVYTSKATPMVNIPVGFGFDPNPKE